MKSLAENRQAKDGIVSFMLPVFVRTLSMSTFHAKGLTRNIIIAIIVHSVNMQFPSKILVSCAANDCTTKGQRCKEMRNY